jgi:hypothetical protein
MWVRVGSSSRLPIDLTGLYRLYTSIRRSETDKSGGWWRVASVRLFGGYCGIPD